MTSEYNRRDLEFLEATCPICAQVFLQDVRYPSKGIGVRATIYLYARDWLKQAVESHIKKAHNSQLYGTRI